MTESRRQFTFKLDKRAKKYNFGLSCSSVPSPELMTQWALKTKQNKNLVP